MIKDIIYNGITATPSDYSSPDGDLATAINLIPEEGGLVPQLPPAELKLQNGNILLLEEGEVLKHIHSTASYKHYITQKEYNLYYIDDDSGEKKKILTYENNIYDVKSIGNVLIVLTDTGINFLLMEVEKILFHSNPYSLHIAFTEPLFSAGNTSTSPTSISRNCDKIVVVFTSFFIAY